MFAASKSGKAAAAAAATDPYFPYVPLLLNTTSTNGQQNNTFLDSSTNNFTITRNGTPTQGAFTPYQPSGYWSGIFNGSTDYLNFGNQTALHLGSGNFTIESWIWKSANSQYMTLCGDLLTVGSNTFQIIADVSGTKIGFFSGVGAGAFIITSSASIPLNSWMHIAFVRNSGTLTLYINGVLDSSATLSTDFNATTSFFVAHTPELISSRHWNGYISNFRVVKGTAVYTSAFTPPTTPLTAITNTSLLTLQSNRFIDNSTNNFAITVNGTPKVQAFQPFAPAASYSPATYGGSGYFNGSTDYLTGTSPSMSGTWTVELWWYPITASTQQTIISFNNGSNGGINIFRNTSNQIGVDDGLIASPIFTGGTVATNVWNHIAIVRNGSTTTGYINGVSVGSNTFTPATVSAFQIARYNFVTFPYLCSGYISNLRVVVGTAVYTSAFTPPTTPVTAVSGTSLLTNFTNAGIYDASWQNNALTVGDAQVSTTQSQWSPTSMKFDGTGDYLTLQSNPSFVFGTNDFTIEAWVYLNAMSGDYFVISAIGSTGAFFGFRNGTDIGYGRVATAWDYNTPSGISTGSWKHIAWCRNGTNMRMFVNGTQVGATQTTSTSYNLSISNTNVGSQGANYYFNGYIQDLRLTNGYARYTANFSVPTAAFPTR